MRVSRLLLIPISLGLFACASNEPKPPKITDSFSTLILADDTKQFSYTLMMEIPERGGGKRLPRGGKGMGGGGMGGAMDGGPGGPPPDDGRGKGPRPDRGEGGDDMMEGLKHTTEEGLLAKLEDTGYCTNGYHQLETQARRGAMNIVGECYDKATAADRTKFPNPEPKKIVEERLD